MIERYLIRYFLAVVDRGSFSRAAQHCGVSQPTLSIGIAKLEAITGELLFHRSSRRVELTEAGTRFGAHARQIEAEFAKVEAGFGRDEPRKAIRIGIVPTIPSAWIERALLTAGAVAGERLEIVEGRLRDLTVRLDNARLDVLVGPLAGDHRPAEPLFEEGYALAMPRSHRLAAREIVEPAEVAGETMLVRRSCEALADVSRFFTERGVRPFFAARTVNDDRALAYVRAGLGITVMPACYAGHGVAMPRLAGFDVRRRIGFTFDPAGRARVAASRSLQAFREVLTTP